MIYINPETMERALSDYNDQIESGESTVAPEDDNFRCGYSTAWDIATCYNAETIWHKVCDSLPAENEDVIIYYGYDYRNFGCEYAMAVACYNSDIGWCCNDDAFADDGHYVIAWCELPDAPDFTERSVPDESTEA